MSAATPSPIDRNEATGYWGRDLCRRDVGNAVFQLHEANAPPEAVTAHGHTHAHIVFVTGGAYVTSVTGENAFVATPVAVMNPPGTWHRDHFVGGRGQFMTVDLHHAGLPDDYCSHDQSYAMLSSLSRLAANLRAADALALEDAAAALADCFGDADGSKEPPPSDGVMRAYQAIMDSSAPWALTLEHLSRASGLHPNSLPRAFRSRFGRTVSQTAKARQVELCGIAMANGAQPLAQIAVDFGFYDQAHLTTAFKNATSMTPARWLKSLAG